MCGGVFQPSDNFIGMTCLIMILCLLQSIVKCLSEPEVGQSEHLPLLQELLSAVIVVTQQAKQESKAYSLELFTITLRVSASNHADSLGTKVFIIIIGVLDCKQFVVGRSMKP